MQEATSAAASRGQNDRHPSGAHAGPNTEPAGQPPRRPALRRFKVHKIRDLRTNSGPAEESVRGNRCSEP